MDSKRLRQLDREFKQLQQEMHDAANLYGLTHPVTIDASHRVDRVHNEINRITGGKINSYSDVTSA